MLDMLHQQRKLLVHIRCMSLPWEGEILGFEMLIVLLYEKRDIRQK